MSKKKLVSLCLVLALVLTAVIGGTMAYFTDTDSAKNVMTVGNVDIEQVERQFVVKDGQITGLENFEDNKAMFPVTKELATIVDGKPVWNDTEWPSYAGYKFPADNAISKFITVNNIGKEDAYFRTIILFEMGKLPANSEAKGHVVESDGTKWVHLVEEGRDAYIPGAVDEPMIDVYGYVYPIYEATKNGGADVPAAVKVGDTYYSVYQASYHYDKVDGKTNALAGTEDPANPTKSINSLSSFWLRHNVGNEFYDMVGDEYEVLALSQACQMEGFDNAEVALDTAFGDISELKTVEGTELYRVPEGAVELIAEWFANVQ